MAIPIRVGVMRGGPSNEYEVSLNTGANVLRALRERLQDLYQARDILVGRDGSFHIDGVSFEPEDLHTKVDVVFNALHGAYGEDGKIQGFFETHGIPFTGSGALASAIGMSKSLSKKIYADHGLKTPYGIELSSADIRADGASVVKRLFESFFPPAIVKPSSGGSSVGVSIVRSYDEFPPALEEAARHGGSVLIEEFIPGKEATVGVVENFRGHDLYVLPVVEIRPMTSFFDYAAKYAGKSEEIVPGNFSATVKNKLEDMAAKAHRALGLRHYSRTDFIIHPRRGIYVLETNTLPGLTNESLIPKALRAVGSDTHELVDHLIRLVVK